MANNNKIKKSIINRNTMLNINVHNDDIHEDNHIELCDSEYLTLEECGSFLNTKNCSNILHLNCRSLPRNFDSFCSLISHINQPFLALGLTETWLKPYNADNYTL